jgi:hypothetical protein
MLKFDLGSLEPFELLRMKLRPDNDYQWENEDDRRKARWRRRWYWALGLGSLALLAWFTGWTSSWLDTLILLSATTLVVLLWQVLASRPKRRWKSDSRLFEPPLSRPVSMVPNERPWTWPAHPAISLPLAALLIAGLYWVLVQHQMQVSGYWLVGLLVLALINLWAWTYPLLLVAIVTFGVGVATLVGWLIDLLGLPAALAVIVLTLLAGAAGVNSLFKRIRNNGKRA